MKPALVLTAGILSLFISKPIPLSDLGINRFDQVQEVKAAEENNLPSKIEIKEIDLAAKIVSEGLNDSNLAIVPESGEVVSWYNLGTQPGKSGTAVLAGHNVWDGKKGEFGKLKNLQGGEKIVITTADNKEIEFEVTDINVYPTKEFPVNKVYLDNEGIKLNLITCHGNFTISEGTYDQRLVVTARLSKNN